MVVRSDRGVNAAGSEVSLLNDPVGYLGREFVLDHLKELGEDHSFHALLAPATLLKALCTGSRRGEQRLEHGLPSVGKGRALAGQPAGIEAPDLMHSPWAPCGARASATRRATVRSTTPMSSARSYAPFRNTLSARLRS